MVFQTFLSPHTYIKQVYQVGGLTPEFQALSDCLQYIPGSTIASCSARNDIAQTAAPASRSALNGAVPVSFNFR